MCWLNPPFIATAKTLPPMLASCETDLAREYPLTAAAKWLGNTQVVPMRHYGDVTDADELGERLVGHGDGAIWFAYSSNCSII